MGSRQTPLCGWGPRAAPASPACAAAQPPRTEPRPRAAVEAAPFRTKTASSMAAAQLVPLDTLSPALRDKVKKVLAQPTLVTRAPADEFTATPKMYHWLMDHPDRAALAWQRLGVQCQSISDRGNGRFAWTDDQGSEIVWFPISNGPEARIWYAEGRVRPGALLPSIPVAAVVVMRHTHADTEKATKIRHEVDVFCH